MVIKLKYDKIVLKKEKLLPDIVLPCSLRFDLKKIHHFVVDKIEFLATFMFTFRIKLSITDDILNVD